MKIYKFVNTLDISAILMQTVMWMILSIITFGLASPFFAYYFIRIIINHTEIHEIDN
ncbi:MAG: hypothetical protein PHV05_08320 [Candidatus Riflebacteria bacterium]|nr:hypothetical protein [Candidatus Riflebacteria bacterium]